MKGLFKNQLMLFLNAVLKIVNTEKSLLFFRRAVKAADPYFRKIALASV